MADLRADALTPRRTSPFPSGARQVELRLPPVLSHAEPAGGRGALLATMV